MTEAVIVPRWEWRCFGDRFAQAASMLDGLTPDRVDDSSETYLLSQHSDASIKIRDHLLDVKRLEEVADDLELWRPILKAAFPLSAEQVTTVLGALGAPRPATEAATFADFERANIDPDPAFHAVAVRKRRTHYIVDGCMVELTKIDADEHAFHTLAIESPDRDLVHATIRQLGVEHRANVNMARGLKALVGFGIRRFAIVDIGTNSVKYLVAERDGRETQVLADGAVVTRLGEGLDRDGVLGSEPMRRTVDAIADIVRDAQTGGAAIIVAVGTAGLRTAANRTAFLSAAHDHAGVTVEVISGEDEARLAYLAAVATLPVTGDAFVVFDTGGGSSQFTFGHRERVDERFSLDVGAVRIAERFGLAGPVSTDAIGAALDALAAEFASLRGRPVADTLIGMGGTVTNIAAVRLSLETYDANAVHGTLLDGAEIDRQIELYRTRDPDQRRQIAGLQPARAEVILAGALILRTIVNELGHDSFTVCDRGLRHGIFAERFGA